MLSHLDGYVRWLEGQMMDIVKEHNLSMEIDQTQPLDVGVSAQSKVDCQLHTLFLQPPQEILYLKE